MLVPTTPKQFLLSVKPTWKYSYYNFLILKSLDRLKKNKLEQEIHLFFIGRVQRSLLNKKKLKICSDFWPKKTHGAVPLPVEQVNVDLYGLVDETCLQEGGLGLVDLTAEQQHVSKR